VCQVLLHRRRQSYGLGTMFQQDQKHHDLEAVRVARQTLPDYRKDYSERAKIHSQYPYPFRYCLARHTGLPAFLTGYLDTPVPFGLTNGDGARRQLAQPSARVEHAVWCAMGQGRSNRSCQWKRRSCHGS